MAQAPRVPILSRSMPNLRSVLLVLAGLALSGAAIAVIGRSVDVPSAVRLLVGGNLAAEAMAIAVLAVGIVIRTARWRLFLPPVDGRRISLPRLLPVLLVGYLGNAILPARLGEAVRAVVVSRREQVGVPESVGSVALERVVDTAVLAILGFLASVLLATPSWLVGGTAIVAGGSAMILALLLTAGPRLVDWLSRVSGSRGAQLGSRFLRVASATDRPALALGILLTIGAWSMDVLLYSLAARAIGIELGPAQTLVIVAAASLGTIIPSAPGYIGTFELAASGAAVAVGVSAAPALALAILVHLLTLVPLVLGGLASGVALGVDVRIAATSRTGHATGAPRA